MKTRAHLVWAPALVLALALTGCGPAASPEPSPTPTESVTTPPPSEEPSPEPPSEDIALPRDCTDVFSLAFISEMESYYMPLNHPDVLMEPTRLVQGQSVLAREPALHCTWGAPSEVGVATVIALVSPAQSAAIIADARANGFTCGPVSDVETRCTIFESEEDEFGLYIWGEEHVLRGNAWIATSQLNFDLGSYTDNLVLSLWD